MKRRKQAFFSLTNSTNNAKRELIVSVEEPTRSSVNTLPTASSRINASDKHGIGDEYDVVHAVDEQRSDLLLVFRS